MSRCASARVALCAGALTLWGCPDPSARSAVSIDAAVDATVDAGADDGPDVPDAGCFDTDEDGVGDDVEDAVLTDFDGDGVPNRMDLDSDGDGFSDVEERGNEPVCAPPRSCDDDGHPDFVDLDSDEDGVPDAAERTHDLDPCKVDTNENGCPDIAVVELGGCHGDSGDVVGIVGERRCGGEDQFPLTIRVPPRPDVIPAVVLVLEEVTETLPLSGLRANIYTAALGEPVFGASEAEDVYVDVHGGARLPYRLDTRPPTVEGVFRAALRLRAVTGELIVERNLLLVSDPCDRF